MRGGATTVPASAIRPLTALTEPGRRDLSCLGGFLPMRNRAVKRVGKESIMHKRHLIVLAMMVAIGVFFAGLTIARADSGDDGSDDPTPTCTLPGNDQGDENDQGEDVNDQGEDVQGDDQGDDVQG